MAMFVTALPRYSTRQYCAFPGGGEDQGCRHGLGQSLARPALGHELPRFGYGIKRRCRSSRPNNATRSPDPALTAAMSPTMALKCRRSKW